MEKLHVKISLPITLMAKIQFFFICLFCFISINIIINRAYSITLMLGNKLVIKVIKVNVNPIFLY